MNAINIIAPYKHLGMWVFDDPRVGLSQEPLIAGIDTMLDHIAANIPDGFTIIFSCTPFPDHQLCLEWRRAGNGGNWYYAPQIDREGWLCPALMRYFDEAEKIRPAANEESILRWNRCARLLAKLPHSEAAEPPSVLGDEDTPPVPSRAHSAGVRR